LGVREITELAHQLETVMTRHKGDLLDGKMSETFFLAYGALRHRCAQVLVWGERMKLFSQEGVKPREVRVRTSLLKEILDHIEMESPSSSSSFWDERKSELYALTTVPCIELFRRFDKMILQLSDEFGKRAKLSCSKGGDIRLPYSLWSKWIDPLNHLLRNAMAHGVEGATERFEGQKPSVASIDLSFSLADGFFSIEVSDDGRGIDAEKLYGEWLKKQNSPKGREMSQEEKLQLMFEAGISTAEAVDVYSGRGVGMDIVKAMVESLKGEISIESKWGEGTVIKLRVPFDD
jgi:two-component system chemotaxis sensor kinase CheA